jgi:hypothetical protein
MIVTAVTLQSESVTWMSVAQTKLIDVSMIDLSAASFSKGAFAQVSCELLISTFKLEIRIVITRLTLSNWALKRL